MLISLFQRDAKRILGLQTSIREAGGADIPQSTQQSVDILWRSDFRPDEIISLDGLIVLYDFTYTRHTNTFRCIQPDGRQILFRASDEADLNLWMSTINYAATFRTAGIRLRMSPYDDRSDGDLNLPQPKNQSLAQIKFSTATSIYAASISPSELGFMPAASRTDSGDSAADNVDGQMQDLMFPRAITSDLETWKELPRSMMHHATRGDIERVSTTQRFLPSISDSVVAVQDNGARSCHQA